MPSLSRRHKLPRQQQQKPLLSSSSSSSLGLLVAVVVLALCMLPGSGGVPVMVGPETGVPGETMAGGDEPSGDEDLSSSSRGIIRVPALLDELISNHSHWNIVIKAMNEHEKQVTDEFGSSISYHTLGREDNLLSFPAGCASENLNKEKCLKRLVQGLLKYKVLLKHVESQYPQNPILPDAKFYGEQLISFMKSKMRHPEQVVEPMSPSQEQELLAGLRDPQTTSEFQSKSRAHAILRHMHHFLIDAQRELSRREVKAAIRQRPATGSFGFHTLMH